MIIMAVMSRATAQEREAITIKATEESTAGSEQVVISYMQQKHMLNLLLRKSSSVSDCADMNTT